MFKRGEEEEKEEEGEGGEEEEKEEEKRERKKFGRIEGQFCRQGENSISRERRGPRPRGREGRGEVRIAITF